MKDNNRNIKLKVFVFVIATVILVFLFVVILLRPFICSSILGFGTRQPISIELIQYNQSEGTEENILITDNEEIIDLYDAIRYANIKKVQFDSESLESNGDWTIILHFTNEDVYMSTKGEGMTDSIYFCKYINQSSPYDFIEIWLDNTKLIYILQEYEKG